MECDQLQLQLRPRLCHMAKWADFDGYGFNLHAEKTRPGQFVGQVDPGSPAEAAGLKQGDRIVEVNGVNISHENHRQVVARIKAVSDETRLLVLDSAADDHFRALDVVVRGSMKEVLHLSSERVRVVHEEEEDVDGHGHAHDEDGLDEDEDVFYDQLNVDGGRRWNNQEQGRKKTPLDGSLGSSSPRSTPSPQPHSTATTATASSAAGVASIEHHYDGLDLNMSAAEMRRKIGSKKKPDPRRDVKMDFRRKYAIIDSL